MTEKDRLHDLVDRLPASEIQSAMRYLEFLLDQGEDAVARALLNAPDDDEALEEEDLQALREALADLGAGRAHPHSDVRAEVLKDR